jgi:hypothetical protein
MSSRSAPGELSKTLSQNKNLKRDWGGRVKVGRDKNRK